jgi:hypothetical protein
LCVFDEAFFGRLDFAWDGGYYVIIHSIHHRRRRHTGLQEESEQRFLKTCGVDVETRYDVILITS